ncbi:MAG: glycosyltransferase family 9 protein [Deltaproteobacteria bacterium]|nr:glycosyltransferase family 9 protein [Deltaproteobacteria bacterium]
MMRPKRILIVLHGAIGDVCRGLSLACRIKAAWPDTYLAWAVESKSKDLVINHPAIDRVIVFNRPDGFPAYLRFVQELRSQHFDLVLDLQRHFKSGVTGFLSGARRRIGFNRHNAKEFNWLFSNQQIKAVENFSAKIEHYHLFGDLLGIHRQEPYVFGLTPDESAQTEMYKTIVQIAGEQGVEILTNENLYALLLGSSWPSRFWQDSSYVEVVNQLFHERGAKALLIGGKAEQRVAANIFKQTAAGSAVDLTCKTKLNELGAVFGHCRFAAGSDCGPMHIAAAVATPVISFFGSTSEKRSAPYGSEHLVLNARVKCAPCYKRECPGMGMICMKNISSGMVLELARNILDGKVPVPRKAK